MPNVAFTRKELTAVSVHCTKVSDCCDGDIKVKSKTTTYLPQPNATDVSNENQARYDAYLERAIFYNVTKATYGGLIGQIFSKDSQVKLPDVLKDLEKDTDGKGTTLIQSSKSSVGTVLKKSRVGLLSDYPKIDNEELLSPAEIEELNIRPTIKLYESDKIINWRTKVIGAEVVKSLIVLKESEIYYDDGFEIKERDMYRVLRLNSEGNYQVDIYKTDTTPPRLDSSHAPLNYKGEPLKRIPFEYAGNENNDELPGIPVLYDIAVLNIGHYRNSADYEESCYIVGQPTPWFAGLSEEWVKHNPVIQLGSRGAIPLPEGGSAGLLQAAANVMPFEAMKHKEEQFLALGAKLVAPKGGTTTATEISVNNATENSILSSIANNVSSAYQKALKNCLQFVQENIDEEIVFILNTDFEISKMSVAERNQLLSEWMKGAISFTEYRSNLRKGKIAILEDEQAISEIDEDAANALDLEVKQTAALAKAAPSKQSVGTK